MWIAIIGSVISIILVFVLSLLTLSKGYGYKQTVDPLPEEAKEHGVEQESKGKPNKE